MKVNGAYAYFCDDNGLKRVDATPEEHIANLDKMAAALEEKKQHYASLAKPKPILCLDFDGVIHSYARGWMGADVVADHPVPGAWEFIREAANFFRVVVYSSRSKEPEGIKAMREWFIHHDANRYATERPIIELIEFASEKPAAFLTIDDRAIEFDGNWWALDPEELLKFKPWNKR